MVKPLIVYACTGLLLVGTVSGEERTSLFGAHQREHLDRALDALNMSEVDLRFDKDYGRPLWALERIRKLLDQPLALPPLAARIEKALTGAGDEVWWRTASDLLEVPYDPRPSGDQPVPVDWGDTGAALAEALSQFVAASGRSAALVEKTFSALSPPERERLAAYLLGTFLDVGGKASDRAALGRAGCSADAVAALVAQGEELDPEPAARSFLDGLQRVDLAALLQGGERFVDAVRALADAAARVEEWPKEGLRLPTPYGLVVVGTTGHDVYAEPSLLVLDPGGDDTYEVGAANGLQARPLAAVVDLGGNDTYRGAGLLGPGAALLGVAVLLDGAGDDHYAAPYLGQAAAVLGVGWLQDDAGDDDYRARVGSQGAATVGVAVLHDRAGNDNYQAGLMSQAFAGVCAVAGLVDEAGHDRYYAGGVERDHERHDDRFLSLSQGMSMGLRPFFGGGYAMLLDEAGNDSYHAEIFGQGVAYWYAAGFLVDEAGNDTYDVYHYGQGSGIHLSLGMLSDGGGNDRYAGHTLVQGNAHDYAVGLLRDAGGDDVYTADHDSQGRAMNNAIGLLLDEGGDDAYFARQPELCQGIGNDGGRREYGSLGLLLDLGGRDHYSCAAEDGARLLRPDFGIVYDLEEPDAE